MTKKKNVNGIYIKEEFDFTPDFSSVNKKSEKDDKNGKKKKKEKHG